MRATEAALTRRSSPPAFPPPRFRLRRASRLAWSEVLLDGRGDVHAYFQRPE
jgi:hypothetical protein